ncbi:uracil-DNA glycosylase [Aureimonas sp. Leaf324]|uniref:uracil-DNA glycosylase n=1 Tax=Aureimonas sp. Leaf324 TaxID=1736336 RepID=UPI0006FBDD14|nr:uracil-DNA glycosylase [Aureimonas sp. Leaf324]KQQ85831.1 DNA polymerase [Aureimonas sp. Leaf324]
MSITDATAPLDEWRAVLAWYEQAGISTFVGETPRDRFAETEAEASRRRSPAAEAKPKPAQPPAPATRPAVAARPAPIAPDADATSAADARDQAVRAQTLGELREMLAAFTGCGLRQTAKNLVFGNGAEDADVMFVGEAPGRDEDLAGEPFVGKSGQLLNRMLATIGIERDAVRVTNTVPWRPPGNRAPTPAETEACLPFTLRHIELVRPRVVVSVGSSSCRALLRTDEGITRLRGRWLSLTTPGGLELPVLPILHPAFLLRQPMQKRLAWRDLQTLRDKLAEPATPHRNNM